MTRYKLFVEAHQVTLVERETQRRETWARSGKSDVRYLRANVMCRRLGIIIDLEEIL